MPKQRPKSARKKPKTLDITTFKAQQLRQI